MEDIRHNFIKRLLISINIRFQQNKLSNSYTVNPQNYKLDAKLGIAKNFMRLTNKALMGMNKIHFRRLSIFSSLSGCLLGYLCAQADDNLQLILKNYEQTIKKALIQSVLRNQSIKNKLNETLLSNVYTNPDIQYKLHQILATKAIMPQKNNLFQLSNIQLIKLFQSEEFIKLASGLAAKAITSNSNTIAKLALQFLNSDTMMLILKDNLVKLLHSEDLNELVADQTKLFCISQLKHDGNKEVLYNLIRQKFINW